MKDRVFKGIFNEYRVHVAGLMRLTIQVWWDGEDILFVGRVFRRNDSSHEWPDESDQDQTAIRSALSLTAAVRYAVKHADEFIEREFKTEDEARDVTD